MNWPSSLKHKSQQALGTKFSTKFPRKEMRLGVGDVIDVPGLPNAVYVRDPLGGTPIIVWNFRVPKLKNLPVMIGEDELSPGVLQTLGYKLYPGSSISDELGAGPHANSHTWGGSDPVYIHTKQILPGLATPSGSSLTLIVYPTILLGSGSLLVDVPYQTIDLTSSRPTGLGAFNYVLVTADASGALVATSSGSEIFADLSFPGDVPPIPLHHSPICSVRMYYGQTTLSNSYSNPEIRDLRFPLWSPTIDASKLVGKIPSPQDAGWIQGIPVDVPTAADNLQAATYHSVTGRIQWTASSGSTPTGLLDYILIRDQQAQNTADGTFTSGAWRTRTLNTEVVDTGNHASISSNQITLAAGTYRCHILCPAWVVRNHQAKLYNISDSADILIGTSEYSNYDYPSMTFSRIIGRFTLAASKVLEVQHRCTTTRATDGFGNPCNFTTEVYTIAEFWKEE